MCPNRNYPRAEFPSGCHFLAAADPPKHWSIRVGRGDFDFVKAESGAVTDCFHVGFLSGPYTKVPERLIRWRHRAYIAALGGSEDGLHYGVEVKIVLESFDIDADSSGLRHADREHSRRVRNAEIYLSGSAAPRDWFQARAAQEIFTNDDPLGTHPQEFG